MQRNDVLELKPEVLELITDEVRQAGASLLQAIAAACNAQRIDRDTAEGKISLLLAQMGEDLEQEAARLPQELVMRTLVEDETSSAQPKRGKAGRPRKTNPFSITGRLDDVYQNGKEVSCLQAASNSSPA